VDTRPVALILIVLGLLLGPGYYAYCAYLSGEEAGRYELQERAERWTLPDGSIQRFSGHLAYRPVILELTPERNDVRLRLTFHAALNAGAGENRYQVTLFDLDQPVVQRDVEVALSAGHSASVEVATIPVRQPSDHIFILEEVGAETAAVTHVTLIVAQDVERLVPSLAWTGVAMLVGGCIVLAFPLRSRR
jgi:hypothetical protein